MNGGAAAEAIVILALFLGGVVLGILMIVSSSIKKEDRSGSLTGRAPDAASRGARVLTGVGSRDVGPPEV